MQGEGGGGGGGNKICGKHQITYQWIILHQIRGLENLFHDNTVADKIQLLGDFDRFWNRNLHIKYKQIYDVINNWRQ